MKKSIILIVLVAILGSTLIFLHNNSVNHEDQENSTPISDSTLEDATNPGQTLGETNVDGEDDSDGPRQEIENDKDPSPIFPPWLG